MLGSSGLSSTNGRRKRRWPMLQCSSIEPAHDSVVDRVQTSCGDDFPTDFRFSSTRSVRRRLSTNSDVTGASSLNGLGKRKQPMSVCSSVETVPTDHDMLDGASTTCADDFRSDFNFSSTRSVRRRMSAHSDDIPQTEVMPAVGSSREHEATLENNTTLLSHQSSMLSCMGDGEAEAFASSVISTPPNSHAETGLGKNVLDKVPPACDDDFPTSFASKATRPVRRRLCTQPTSDCHACYRPLRLFHFSILHITSSWHISSCFVKDGRPT